MTSADFLLTPISAKDANEHRRVGGTVYIADSTPGYPCRQCLTDAEVGEELILVSHDWQHWSPAMSSCSAGATSSMGATLRLLGAGRP